MKKGLLFVLFLISFVGFAQCPSDPITLSSQAEVDAFLIDYPNCAEISFGITVSGNDVVNLLGLENIEIINGELNIHNASALLSLDDLHSLVQLDKLRIDTTGIIDITALGGVNISQSVYISRNYDLNNCNISSIEPILDVPETYIQYNAFNCDKNRLLNNFGDCPKVNYEITSQTKANNFPLSYPDCTQLSDFWIISGSDINDLTPFSNITNFRNLRILSNPILENLQGLENVIAVKELNISDNPNLINLHELNSISTFDNVFIINNDLLVNLVGLEGLTQPNQSAQGIITLRDNDLLNSLEGLDNLFDIDYFNIENNNSLTTFKGLDALQTVYELVVKNSPNLTSISALRNVQSFNRLEINNTNALSAIGFGADSNFTIGYLYLKGTSLETLQGMEKLVELENSLRIESNPNLLNLNGLQNATGVNYLELRDNTSLNDISDLSGINRANSINIIDNDNLVSLDGVNFNSTGYLNLIIKDNEILSDISVLSGLSGELGGVEIINNPTLASLSSLNNFTQVDQQFFIEENTALISLDGLQNISQFGYAIKLNVNNSLTDITSLENADLTYINTLEITNNENLSQCSILSICNFLNNGTITPIIENNATGCASKNEVLVNCGITNNIIEGTINFDFDNNGCDGNDYAVNNILVSTTDGTSTFTTTTSEVGTYSFFVGIGTFNTEINPESLPINFQVLPNTIETTFTDYGNTENVNFCLTATSVFNDLKIVLLPLNAARPGFDAEYQLLYENVGTTALSGEITLQFDDSRQTFLNAVPNAINVSGNTITWNYADLLPFQSETILINFNTLPPPTNNSGDILAFEAIINPVTDDENPQNNTYNLEQIIVNSFDPNDKQVNQGEEIYESETANYLDYIVRFQNTGTADAINVRIEDLLSDKLDWNTIRPLSASHEYRVEIIDGNHVSFIFDNINLPPEASDPEGSNGFVAFQIKPIQNIALGDVVQNTADIYFDFNAAIVTNTVSTTVVENLGVEEFGLDGMVQLYPNPVSSSLQIKIPKIISFEKATVYSLLGEQILQTSEKQLNLDNLSAGIYFVEVVTDKGNVTKKIVKE
ncbi:T9SS type A sorting domain-containing protein [Aequorivita capsosiphonis]|uniref:T9SS type A sorting domain-containing protein n=1 Tax=Aequorivita capsosiphonis TaxID=487317 RepID=UPI0004243589|nr:T9SS type A sorting domain-containing protein [Aequorivita capsosiphonis]